MCVVQTCVDRCIYIPLCMCWGWTLSLSALFLLDSISPQTAMLVSKISLLKAGYNQPCSFSSIVLNPFSQREETQSSSDLGCCNLTFCLLFSILEASGDRYEALFFFFLCFLASLENVWLTSLAVSKVQLDRCIVTMGEAGKLNFPYIWLISKKPRKWYIVLIVNVYYLFKQSHSMSMPLIVKQIKVVECEYKEMRL